MLLPCLAGGGGAADLGEEEPPPCEKEQAQPWPAEGSGGRSLAVLVAAVQVGLAAAQAAGCPVEPTINAENAWCYAKRYPDLMKAFGNSVTRESTRCSFLAPLIRGGKDFQLPVLWGLRHRQVPVSHWFYRLHQLPRLQDPGGLCNGLQQLRSRHVRSGTQRDNLDSLCR
jgi:hypothetical protein